MKTLPKKHLKSPPETQNFRDLFLYIWNHGIGNRLSRNGDPVPWRAEDMEHAFTSVGKPVDRRTIQNWRSSKNIPGRRNLHALARVASGGDEYLRGKWAEALIKTLDNPVKTAAAPAVLAKPGPDIAGPKKRASEKIAPEVSDPPDTPPPYVPKWVLGAIVLFAFLGLTFLVRFLGTAPKDMNGIKIAAVPSPMSVAVLPFEDMSADKSLGYFAEGMADDVINALVQLPDLEVAARRDTQSALAELSDAVSTADLRARLNVAYVLEAAVQKEADRIKINARLIKTDSGEHVWASTFDDSLSSLFETQEAISSAVATALNIYMSPERRAEMFSFGTENPEAYDTYLKARYRLKYWHEDRAGNDIWDAAKAFETVVGMDGAMAKAWLHYSDIPYHLAAGHIQPMAQASASSAEPKAEVREAAAEQLIFMLKQSGRYASTEAQAQQSRLNEVFFSKDWSDLRRSTLAFADLAGKRRGELEWLFGPVALVMLGETAAMENLLETRMLKFDPKNGTGHAYGVRAHLTAGDLDAAAARLAAAEAETFSSRLDEVRGYLLFAQQDAAGLRAHTENAQDLSAVLQDYFKALCLSLEGQPDAARKALLRSEALAGDRLHLALGLNHIGETGAAAKMLTEMTEAPLGVSLLSVVLAYGAACGPADLPPLPAYEARLSEAGIDPLPCIGQTL